MSRAGSQLTPERAGLSRAEQRIELSEVDAVGVLQPLNGLDPAGELLLEREGREAVAAAPVAVGSGLAEEVSEGGVASRCVRLIRPSALIAVT